MSDNGQIESLIPTKTKHISTENVDQVALKNQVALEMSFNVKVDQEPQDRVDQEPQDFLDQEPQDSK